MAENRNKLIGNFMSLSFQQGIAIIFPLVIFPFLLRILGVSGFGVFTLVQTGIMYFDLLIAFGFGLTATQHIAKAGADTALHKKIIIAVYTIKIILFVASLVALLCCLFFIDYLQQHIGIILFAAIYLLGNLLFPDWYFQGIQQMKICSFITIISKAVSLLLIIVLVKKEGDIDMAFLGLGAGNLLAGIIGLIVLQNKVRVNIAMPDKVFCKALFKESSYVFGSIILAPLYSSVNVFILQIFAAPLVVGAYAVAQKIFSAVSMLTSVVNGTFFPYLSKLHHDNAMQYKRTIVKLLWVITAGFAVCALMQYFLARPITQLLVGKTEGQEINYTVLLLRIMSIALFFSPFVSFFFQQMIIQGEQKKAIQNIVIAVLFNLITAFILGRYWGGVGMAVNVCLVVTLIAFLNAVAVNQKLKLWPAP